MRIKFKSGEQRKFLKLALKNLNCVSLRSLLQFGLDTNYSCLKNYYLERRLLPKDLFFDLCHLAKLDPKFGSIKVLDGNWGQVKGGKTKNKKR